MPTQVQSTAPTSSGGEPCTWAQQRACVEARAEARVAALHEKMALVAAPFARHEATGRACTVAEHEAAGRVARALRW